MRRKELNLCSFLSLLLLLNHRWKSNEWNSGCHAALITKRNRPKNNMWLETVIHILKTHNDIGIVKTIFDQTNQKKLIQWCEREKKESTHFVVCMCNVYVLCKNANDYFMILLVIAKHQFRNDLSKTQRISPLGQRGKLTKREEKKMEIVIMLIKMVDIIRNIVHARTLSTK